MPSTSPATNSAAIARGASTTNTVPIAAMLSSQPMRMNSRVRAISSSRIASAAVPSADASAGAGGDCCATSMRASGAISGISPLGKSAVTSLLARPWGSGRPAMPDSTSGELQLELEAHAGDEGVRTVAARVTEPLQIRLHADEVGEPGLVERLDEALVAPPGAAAELLGDREVADADPGGVVVARADAVPRRRAAGVVRERAAIRARPAVAHDHRQAARVVRIVGVEVDPLVVLHEPAGVAIEHLRIRDADLGDVVGLPPRAEAGRAAVAIGRPVAMR